MFRFNPYLHFQDNAREAMEFYKSVFGGELILNTFQEAGLSQDPVEGKKIMHSILEAGSVVFMASDTPPHMQHEPGRNVSMSLSGDDEAELRGYWEKLAVGATIEQPLETAPWGDTFGMMTDRFQIRWMVNITGKKA